MLSVRCRCSDSSSTLTMKICIKRLVFVATYPVESHDLCTLHGSAVCQIDSGLILDFEKRIPKAHGDPGYAGAQGRHNMRCAGEVRELLFLRRKQVNDFCATAFFAA